MFFPHKSLIRKEISSLPMRRNLFELLFTGRTSPFISGSLTVEAACTLPLFLAAMIAVMFFINVVTTSVQVSQGLHEAGRQMALLAYVKDAADIDSEGYLTGALSLVYANGKVKEKVSEEITGLSLLRSGILRKDEMIDLVAEYFLDVPMLYLGDQKIYMLQRARVRAWTGRDTDSDGKASGESGTTVYVTVNGSVYHKDRECSHIRLSIQMVNRSQMESMRNTNGGKYHPCEACKGGTGNQMYVTDSGDRYHSSTSCSGLKRGVISVLLSEVESWSPCSRCGQ